MSTFATGSTRFTIGIKAFSKVKVNLPSIPEQQKIANYLTSLDRKINQTQTQLTDMQTYKRGLLQQLFV